MKNITKIVSHETVLILGSFAYFNRLIDEAILSVENVMEHVNNVLTEYGYNPLELSWFKQKIREMAAFGLLQASGDGYIITSAGMIAHTDASQAARDMHSIVDHINSYSC